MGTEQTSAIAAETVSADLTGRQFYRPVVIGLYCALSIPVGLYLCGINASRRGQRVMGLLISALSAVLLIGMLVLGALGGRLASIGLLGIILGVALISFETPAYRWSLARGGTPARSWPPLLWVGGTLLLFVIAIALFAPLPSAP